MSWRWLGIRVDSICIHDYVFIIGGLPIVASRRLCTRWYVSLLTHSLGFVRLWRSKIFKVDRYSLADTCPTYCKLRFLSVVSSSTTNSSSTSTIPRNRIFRIVPITFQHSFPLLLSPTVGIQIQLTCTAASSSTIFGPKWGAVHFVQGG